MGAVLGLTTEQPPVLTVLVLLLLPSLLLALCCRLTGRHRLEIASDGMAVYQQGEPILRLVVAAGAAVDEPPSGASSPPDDGTPPAETRVHNCVVCLRRHATCQFHPCGHILACRHCAQRMVTPTCFLCRGRVHVWYEGAVEEFAGLLRHALAATADSPS